MVDITGHRDHAMLDVAVISAVHELASARRTRMLSLIVIDGEQMVRQRACIDGKGICTTVAADVPLATMPSLSTCLEQNASSAGINQGNSTTAGESLLWMPIWMGDKVDTVLEVMRDGPFPVDMVPMVTGIVGVYRNFQNLLDYSERDSLTGLLNRKTFDGQLTRMLQASGTQLTPSLESPANESGQWLVVADIDFFKSVNDRYGHVFGDEVLILVANMLVSSFRADDRVFRFGGEEFVILLRSATREQAHHIIERFRTNLEEHVFPQVGSVTVSLGYVQVRPGDSPVASLGHADQALYHAKTHGRNRSCHYDDIVAAGELQLPTSNDTAEFF
jgi:diguanylate cyclase (GGDEF)-like protein